MELIKSLALFPILGKPLVVYGGLVTLCSFLFTAYISISNMKGNHRIPLSWHPKMAILSITMGILHGFLAFSIFW